MNTLASLLLFQTLALSAAVLLVALLRQPVARVFDARAVYLLWLCVPTALVVAALPSPWTVAAPTWLPMQEMLAPATPAPTRITAPVAPTRAALSWAEIGATVWLVGAALLALGLALQQRRFSRWLRPVPGAAHWQLPAASSACIVGVWQPRLALPADFDDRFSPAERELILAHETVHLRRHDNAWNLLAALCCCLQWFNPLAWWAWRRMRADQELACDAVVLIERQPAADLACYATALVRSHDQANRALLPTLASPWRPRAGLVERVAHLQVHARRRGRKRHDRGAVALLVLALAGTVSAGTALQQPAKTSWLLAPKDSEALPAQAAYGDEPSTLRWRLKSREDGALKDNSVQAMTLMPGKSPGGVTSRSIVTGPSGPLWCFETFGTRFRDGTWRFGGRLLDAECKAFLTDPKDLAPDGSAHAFQGRLPDGTALDVEVSALRFALPPGLVWLDIGLQHNLQLQSPVGMRLMGTLGERMSVQANPKPGDPGDQLAVEVLTTAEGDGSLARVQTRLMLGQPRRLLAEPQLVTRWDESATVRWQDPASERYVEVTITPHRSRVAMAPEATPAQ